MFCGETIIPKGLRGSQLSFKFTIRGGVFGGKRFISKEWCDIVFERGYELKEIAPGCHAKGGMCGQMLLVDRNRRAVVAWLGFDSDGYSERMRRFIAETH